MVYLFHFELPVNEATWTCFATAYRPYLKCLTLSEVDALAVSVMHLSRAYDHVHHEATTDDTGVAVHIGSAGETADGGDDVIDKVTRPAGPITTFLSFFYVNTKKGKNPVASQGSDVAFRQQRSTSADRLIIVSASVRTTCHAYRTLHDYFHFLFVSVPPLIASRIFKNDPRARITYAITF
jgi:hypothetical protein